MPPQVDGNADLAAGELITSGSGSPADAVKLWERELTKWKSQHPTSSRTTTKWVARADERGPKGSVATHESTRRRRRRRRVLWPYLYVLPAARRDGVRVRVPARAGRARQLLRGLVRLADLGRARQLPGVIDDPEFRAVAAQQPQAAAGGAGDARPRRSRSRSCSTTASAAGASTRPSIFLPYVLPATRDRHRVLVPAAAATACSTRRCATRTSGFLAQDWLGNSHLAIVSVGGLVVWQQLGFGVVVFTAALLAPAARDRRGGAHRRRGLVEPAVPRARAADPPDHRAAHGDPGDHRALVGLQLRLRAHRRAAPATPRA